MSTAHNGPMAKNSAISVRLPDEVKAALDQAARDDGRSVASYVGRLREAHLKSIGALKP